MTRTRIVTQNFILDLSGSKFSSQEENSKVSDKITSSFIYPFEIELDDSVLYALPGFNSHQITDIETQYDCYFEHENKTEKGKFQILGLKGKKLKGQVDYGLEKLPNFEKKLSDINYEEFEVNDIHTYATTHFNKSYPEINFNFPKIYTNKYRDSEAWNAFDGFLNSAVMVGSTLKMKENYIDNSGNIFNVNIIHPCPYLLYLLKVGFQDGGCELKGDILTDELLQKACIYSGNVYFGGAQQQRIKLDLENTNFTKTLAVPLLGKYAFYDYKITLTKKGKYKIAGSIKFKKPKKKFSVEFSLKLGNGSVIWSKLDNSRSKYEVDIPINMEFQVPSDNMQISIVGITSYSDSEQYQISNLLITSDALEEIEGSSVSSDASLVVNSNKINLKKAVPDITFAELVNFVKNMFNYSLEYGDNSVIMNQLEKENPFKSKDFQKFEVEEPEINYLKEKTFLLKFSEVDGYKFDSVFFSKEGIKLNETGNSNTNVIEIKGYPLPVEKSGNLNIVTAHTIEDTTSKIQLIYYDGLTGNQNIAKQYSSWFLPNLFILRWNKWLKRRLTSVEYVWSFTSYISEMALYNITDYIYCYKGNHIVKSRTKDKTSESEYVINIVTERIN